MVATALGVVAVACARDESPAARAPSVDDAAPRPTADAGSPVVAPIQTWYLERDASKVGDDIYWTRSAGTRATLALSRAGDGAPWTGTLTDDGGETTEVTALDVTETSLSFRRRTGGTWQHYRLRTALGTAAGRLAVTTSGSPAPAAAAFDHHVTGWSAEAFPLTGDALSWDLGLGDGRRARLWIARDASRAWTGRFKVYAGPKLDPSGEQLEEDLYDVAFDGKTLTLGRPGAGGTTARIEAQASGRTLRGTLTDTRGATTPLEGPRAALMSYGVSRKDRSAWQLATRQRIENLMMNGAPAPATPCKVVVGAPQPPLAAALPPERDDDAGNHPQDYTRSELTLTCPVSNPFDGRAIASPRIIHGWLAVPTSLPPSGRHPVVVAVNGHGGTADAVMASDSIFHYGDAFARRGFVVMAVDIKHHPDEPIAGEDGVHPAITGDGFATSDWEEDGERVWDVLRATDWLLSRDDVDASHPVVTGLSMGGEETTLLAALDTRFAVAIPAGYSPDMDVLLAIGGHNCWQWRHADIREYLDQSDLHALIAPRGLLVQTGKLDGNYSARTPTWSADVQVMRKTRAAWASSEESRVQHYLHYDEHAYHFGDRRPGEATGLGVVVTLDPGARPASQAWQTDGATVPFAKSVFDVVARWQ